MSKEETIWLLNLDKRKSVTIHSFDNDSVTLPANQLEALEVDAKFAWKLPRTVKNLSAKQPNTEPVKEEVVEDTPVVNNPPKSPVTPLKT